MLVYLTRVNNPSNIIALDAVETVGVSRSGSPARQTLQNGVNVADHYTPSLPSVTFSGLVSNSKLPAINTPTVANFVKWVNELMDSQTVFTLYGSEEDGIPTLNNCVIIDFNYDKGVENLNSLRVNFTIEQLDFGLLGKKGAITAIPAASTQGQLGNSSTGSSGSKTYDSLTDPKSGLPYTQLKLEQIKAQQGRG